MIIGDNAGHTLNGLGSGSVGFIEESICTRQISKYFKELLEKNNHKAINCTINKSDNYLYEVVKLANKQHLDFAISHHLNHSDNSSANGVEVWIYDIHDSVTYAAAERICKELEKLGFRNRGVKENRKYTFIKNTNSKALLIEYLFCSNKSDVEKYNPEKLAKATYIGLTKEKIEFEKNNTNLQYPNGDYDCEAKVINTNNLGLNVREDRSCNSKVIRKLGEGSIVKVDYCINNWFSVWENGECGFVFGEYLKLL